MRSLPKLSPTRALAACLLALSLQAGPARADEVLEMLDRARALYQQGNLSGALGELGFASGAITQQRQAHYAALFPAAPTGWTLEEAQDSGPAGALAAQMLGGGMIVTRDYTQQGGEGRISAKLVMDSPLVQGMAMLVTNPAMLPPGAKRIRIGAENAILKQEAGSKEMELTLVKGATLLQLEGENLASQDVLVSLMKGFDLKKITGGQ